MTLILCSAVFCIVATAAYLFRDERERSPGIIGSTYALHRLTIYQGRNLAGPSAGIVPPQGVVDVTGFELAGDARDWIQVRSNQLSGYVHPDDVAPPKVSAVGQGYPLLKGYLAHVGDPSVAPLAADSIDSYRHDSGENAHADELEWMLVERLRTMKRSADLLRVEKLEYGKLAAKPGDYQQLAEVRMAQLSQNGQETANKARH